MKRNIIIKGIVFFILMAACVFRFETDLMAAGAAGVVTISVEKFTIGQGYLVDPATVPITEGQSVADVLIPLLKNNGYEPEIATGAMYYLAGILKADNGNYKVPAIIGTMGGMTSSSGSGLTPPDGTEKNLVFPDLFELSYTQSAGWVYSVNGDFPTETMNDYRLKDGDVIRVQFTLYGYGGDVGQRYGNHPYLKLPDRNPLTKRLALMKTYKAICDGKGYAGAYSSAYAAAVNMDVSDADFYAAVNALPKEEQIISWVKEAEALPRRRRRRNSICPPG